MREAPSRRFANHATGLPRRVLYYPLFLYLITSDRLPRLGPAAADEQLLRPRTQFAQSLATFRSYVS